MFASLRQPPPEEPALQQEEATMRDKADGTDEDHASHDRGEIKRALSSPLSTLRRVRPCPSPCVLMAAPSPAGRHAPRCRTRYPPSPTAVRTPHTRTTPKSVLRTPT